MYKANMSASRILRAPERFFVALDPRSIGVSSGAFRRDLASLVFMADLLFITALGLAVLRDPVPAPLMYRLSAFAGDGTVRTLLPRPGAHAIGHAFIEIRRTDRSLYASEPHALSHLVADAGKGHGDALAMQHLDEGQQLVTGGGVDKVYRA